MRRTVVSRPIGMFAGNPTLPQELSGSVHSEFVDGMSADPGLRLAAGTGRRRWYAGLLTPQQFARTMGGPNSDEALAVAAVIRNNRRSAIGKGRATGDSMRP